MLVQKHAGRYIRESRSFSKSDKGTSLALWQANLTEAHDPSRLILLPTILAA
jgi:hypothetical protein